MDIEFEWDANKEIINIKKHGISFVAAAKLFSEAHYEAPSDRNNEIRYLAVGEVAGRVVAVVYTKRGENYRIISARRAREYEETAFKEHCKI